MGLCGPVDGLMEWPDLLGPVPDLGQGRSGQTVAPRLSRGLGIGNLLNDIAP